MKLIAFVVLLAIVVGWGAVHFIAPRLILQPYRAKRIPLMNRDSRFLAETVTTDEGFKLDGYQRKVAAPKAVVILLHGIGSSKEVYDDLSHLLADQFNVASFAFDNRAQGKSQGQFVTFGYYEKEDIKKIVNLAQERYPNVPVGLWGHSLGGAVALQSLAVDQRLSFGIIESTFARLDETVFAYSKRLSGGLSTKWLADYALNRAGKVANFDPDQVQPAEAAKSITVPVLLAHGEVDIHIDKSKGEAIFANLAGDDNELIIVAGADHGSVHAVGGEDYFDRIRGFIERVVEPSNQ